MEDVCTATTQIGFWNSIRDAVRGSDHDFTAGSLNRAIFLLAIPMILEMALESLFGVVDILWVARVGANAVAAVGVTESLGALLFSVVMGLSLSTSAVVARRIGEKDLEGAAVASVQSILLGLATSVIIGVPCWLLAPHLLGLMGGSPEVLRVGSTYARLALGCSGVVVLLSINNAIFRGAGDAAIAARVLLVSNLVNMVLDPCLIFGLGPFPRLGVTGAAIATLTGRSIGLAYQLIHLLRGTRRIRIERRHIRMNLPVLRRLCRLSSTGTLQFAIAEANSLGLVRVVSIFGAGALAGYTIALRMSILFLLPCWGLSGAAATLVGQNLGARQSERAEAAVWRTGLYNMVFLGAVSIFFIALAEPLARLFSSDPLVVRSAASCLRILSYGNVAYAYGMVMLQAFNGAGDTVTPTLVNLVFSSMGLLMAGWLAIAAGLRSDGVYWSSVITNVTIALVSVLLFRHGKWKHKQI
jgi:putative MATE family efflux protein